MYLSEILNLYQLSTNPDQLAKHDKFTELGLHMEEYEYIQKIIIKKTVGEILNTDKVKRVLHDGEGWRLYNFLSRWFTRPELKGHLHTQKVIIPDTVQLRWGNGKFYLSYLDLQVEDQIIRVAKLNNVDHGVDIFVAQSNYRILSQALQEKDPKRKARYGLHTTNWKDPTVVQIKPIID